MRLTLIIQKPVHGDELTPRRAAAQAVVRAEADGWVLSGVWPAAVRERESVHPADPGYFEVEMEVVDQ